MALAEESGNKGDTANQQVTETAPPPPPPPPAIPPSMTIPYFSQGFKNVLTSFIGKLVQSGVPRDKINKALSEMLPEMQRIAAASNSSFLGAITTYLDRKEYEGMRKDYMGRALLHDLDQHLPRDKDMREKLTKTPISGFLPIQVAEGLIAALKSAHGLDTIKGYSATCAAKAEQYRDSATGLIDTDKFMEDPEVKKLVSDITTRFRLLMHKKSEADRKKWILNQVSTSHAFREMKRDLTDEELGIITHSFLKTK